MCSDYCVCTTCELGTSCLRCTFVKYCTSVAGARTAILCTTLLIHVCCWCTYCYFVHDIVDSRLLLVHVLLFCARHCLLMHVCCWFTYCYFVHDILLMHVCCWCTYCYFVHDIVVDASLLLVHVLLFCSQHIIHASLLLVHVLLFCARHIIHASLLLVHVLLFVLCTLHCLCTSGSLLSH